ncbi:MAG: histidine kinase [Comamonadaceae bacterium]|nr:MAG: histidine kinase [Comamonadaceae bacterium]
MLSRLGQQEVKLQAVQVLPLLQSVLDELQQQQPQRQVQWHLAQDFPELWADVDMLRQVFTHVLDNAMKFTRKREPAQISISWQWMMPVDSEDMKLCQITITDNGIGFVPEQAAKLFKVFAKLHLARDFEGLGLGLVASRKLLTRMGGSALWLNEGLPAWKLIAKAFHVAHIAVCGEQALRQRQVVGHVAHMDHQHKIRPG